MSLGENEFLKKLRLLYSFSDVIQKNEVTRHLLQVSLKKEILSAQVGHGN